MPCIDFVVLCCLVGPLIKDKFRCFEKVSFSNKYRGDKYLDNLYGERAELSIDDEKKIQDVENKISNLLIQKQRTEYEKKLDNLTKLKNSKGRSAAIYNLRASILGEKKVRQEAVAIEDPGTKSLVFEAEKIKKISLSYLKNLLTNRNPKSGYENDLKVINLVHEVRMAEEIKENDDYSFDDFDELLKHLKKNNKDKYKFILKAGTSLQWCLFNLFKLIWNTETKPGQWENTIAHQLYKGAGEKSKLENHRFIHTKDEIPKAFEHTVVEQSL